MNNILKVGRRNNIETPGRRYNLSQLISESYQTLYNCKLDSNLYRLAESHIASIKRNPEDMTKHSKNLEILKGLVKLGESAQISEADIPVVDELEDEDVIDEDADLEVEAGADVINEDDNMEELEGEDVINEDDNMEELEDEDVINEDDNMEELEDEDVINEEEDIDLEDESPEITPEELSELKKHLKEIRRARRATRESVEDVVEEVPVEESRTWKSEKSSMTQALKNFRESSNKKAFYKSFKKLNECMKSGRTLTLAESVLLYKASNSAMTHLTVELEHNPGFIYTFRECTNLLAKDNAQLLECIRKQVSPSASLVESYRDFSNILLESEDLEDELVEEEEDIVLSDEEMNEIPPEVVEEEIPAEEVPAEAEELQEESEEVEDEIPAPEEDIPAEEETSAEEVVDVVDPIEDTPTEDVPVEDIPTEEVPVEDEIDEDEDELDSEITDEEAEELRNKLMELRRSRRK